MKRNDKKYITYVKILKEELVPAMGCTEPIAISYAAAKAKDILGCKPDRVLIEVSGNIIKNVKSVVVPNTNGLKGIEAAAVAGIIAGKSEKILEVIADVSEEQKSEIREYLHNYPVEVFMAESNIIFDICITLWSGANYSKVRIADYHTNIVKVEKNGQLLYEDGVVGAKTEELTDKGLLNVKDIIEFADSVYIEDIKEIISRQIKYNLKIAEEGLKGSYGANIGQVIMNHYGSNDIKMRAKALAAAGSDARMSGCELPVIINSGSGNQGMTASLPVIAYADELKVGEDMLYRALVVSNLITIHQKTGIGRLSAYCGAVSAGCGSGCGIAYLYGGKYNEISHTLVNAVAIVSGIICDGAKASCAAKIASAVDAGILGYFMYRDGKQFRGGDGIVSKGVEETIANVGRLGKNGMKETDKEIIQIMLNCR